jgi:hypothetical protein
MDNEHLIGKWQDLVLANLIAVNYLNSLMILTSRHDFAFTIPSYYSVRYVENSRSFQQTISQLTRTMVSVLTDARKDLNRVHTGMAHVPDQLKIMSLLVKQASFDLLLSLFPDSFNDIERLVNNSLVVLQAPEKKFEQVLNLLTEIDYLLRFGPYDQMISLQVYDVKTQWTLLTELIIELAKRAETTRQSLLLQFNWVLQEFIRSGSKFPDTIRDFIILLLLPKIVEIDRTSDLLGMVTKTYSDMSFKFTDNQIGGNMHLLVLSEEQDRRRYLNQFRHDLPPQAVQIARLALKQHKEFLQRDKNRQANYETFLANATIADLTHLIDSEKK